MSAARELPAPDLVDLRKVRVEDLNAVLGEETHAWRERLHWDFTPSADLVRRFVGMQALSGYALLSDGRVAGYGYYVCEERKGLIGDLYVMKAHRDRGGEHALLDRLVHTLMRERGVRRIESQLMMSDIAAQSTPPFAGHARLHRRTFMVAALRRAAGLPQSRSASQFRFDNWLQYRQEEAARLIADAYRGHIDSDINDQYRSIAGARRFLMNIVQYPGCGSFFQPASLQASRIGSGELIGICLSSLVSPDTGHITQICVGSGARGEGVGYEMLRRSLLALHRQGCKEATLTVTSANMSAVELYRRMGFTDACQFTACVWEGF